MIYKNNIRTIFSTVVLLSLHSFSSKAQDTVTLHINADKTYQTISNFGASDAWTCQYIGEWPQDKKDKIADLLFSQDTLANGTPKGIGLSLWRYNIGTGSTNQQDKSNITDDWRRTESFLNADGSYDWTKQAGQIWFLKAARERGVKQFLGFSNSPPVYFTINGRSNTDNGKPNISPDKYKAFAAYYAEVIKGVKRLSGVDINYISPVNEPQWKWNDGQEGCPYTNSQIAGLVRTIDTVFQQKHISSKVVVAEAGSLNYLIADVDKQGKGNQINDFFSPNSPDYIGNLDHLNKAIIGHGYFTTSPMKTAIEIRQKVADTVNKFSGLSFWQSEYCILGDNAGEIDGNKRDLGMDAALYLASVIHTDLTAANAAAWQWWMAISPYDYKDGLVYVDKNKTDGNFYASKMLWAFGNYSRFVRPGAIRIEANTVGDENLSKPLLVSAFKLKKAITINIVNNNSKPVSINIAQLGSKVKVMKTYTTSATASLDAKDIPKGNNYLIIPERSVTSIIGIIK